VRQARKVQLVPLVRLALLVRRVHKVPLVRKARPVLKVHPVRLEQQAPLARRDLPELAWSQVAFS
jgi:hypothetical protein